MLEAIDASTDGYARVTITQAMAIVDALDDAPVETPPITTPLVIERDQIVHRYFVQVAAYIDTLPTEPTAGDTRSKRLAVAIIRALGAAGIGVRSIEETRG